MPSRKESSTQREQGDQIGRFFRKLIGSPWLFGTFSALEQKKRKVVSSFVGEQSKSKEYPDYFSLLANETIFCTY
jgi:hypothetical protein